MNGCGYSWNEAAYYNKHCEANPVPLTGTQEYAAYQEKNYAAHSAELKLTVGQREEC